MTTPTDIATALRDDILTGRIQPGEELPQEGLAARFKVSRMPVRDALNALSAERLVTLRPNRGAQVIALTPDELLEIYDLRALLECDLAARAIPMLQPADIDLIRREMLRCELEAGTPDFPAADWRFHKALYAPAGRPRQVRMVEELRALCQMHQAAYDSLRNQSDRWSEDHRVIVDLAAAGQADAAGVALKRHIEASGAQLVGWVREHVAGAE